MIYHERIWQQKKEQQEDIRKRYEKYEAEFATLSWSSNNKKIVEVHWTASENLSYQLGWVNLLSKWEAKEVARVKMKTPVPSYK